MDNQLALLTLFGSIIALLFVASRAQKVLRFPEGNERMRKISASIHQGAMAYLRRQYKILIGFFAVMFVILLVMAITGFLTPYVPFAFVTGGFFSGLSGFVGMQIATRANARTAAACQKSRTWTAGYFNLVSASETGFQTFNRGYYKYNAYLWNGSFFHGTVCTCRRRYLYKSS